MLKQSFVLVMSLTVCAGCALPDLSGREVRQGNVLSLVKIHSLKPGMTKSQVRQTMGDNLLDSPMRRNRWDYVDNTVKRGDTLHTRHLRLYFQKERLVRIDSH